MTRLTYHEHAMAYPSRQVLIHSQTYEQDRQNPLFINRHTGNCVLLSSYFITQVYTEHETCTDCGQQQTIERFQSKRYQINRFICKCACDVTLYKVGHQ